MVVEPSSKVAGTSSFIGTRLLPSVNLGLPVWVCPCLPVDVVSSAVGVTGVTVGVYVAEALVPFMSSRTTVTAGAVPVKLGSGTNVTVPSAATV